MVSVCMATYNGERFIMEQITSILSQLKEEDELVIADDSSSDGTVGILLSLKDPRIRLSLYNTFRDPIRNFQHVLEFAGGEYIFLSDQDDVWLPGKYEQMIEKLVEYDLVISDSVITDSDLKVIWPSFFKFFGSGPGIMKNVWRSSYYGSCMAFRKSLLDCALPFPATKEIGHDLWLGLVAELTGRVLFYNTPLILYRRHALSFTHTGLAKSKRNMLQQAWGRVIMVKEIVEFLIRRRWKRD